MATYDQTKLRSLYFALHGISQVIDTTIKVNKGLVISGKLFNQYNRLIKKANQEFPGLLVVGSDLEFYSHDGYQDESYYNGDAVQANIAVNLAILKAYTEDASQSPVIETKDFDFIADLDLRRILERDYKEIQKSIVTGNWKSAIIVSGGCIEAILLDLCLQNEVTVKSSSKVPSKKPDINDWVLNELIEVTVDVNLVTPDIAKLSHTIREYRNLIHPAVEMRRKLRVEPEEAKIAIEVLNILIRELTP